MYPLFPKISRPRGAPPHLVYVSVEAAESRNLLYRSCSPHQATRCCTPIHISACLSPIRLRSRCVDTAAGPDVADRFHTHRRVRLGHVLLIGLISCPVRCLVGAKNADATFPLICSRSSGARPLPPSRCGTHRAPQFDASGNDAPSAKVQLVRANPPSVLEKLWSRFVWNRPDTRLSQNRGRKIPVVAECLSSPTTVVICPLVDTEHRQSRGRERRHLRLVEGSDIFWLDSSTFPLDDPAPRGGTVPSLQSAKQQTRWRRLSCARARRSRRTRS